MLKNILASAVTVKQLAGLNRRLAVPLKPPSCGVDRMNFLTDVNDEEKIS